ncbi:protease inhibitor Inh/omp19 family protein [Bosea sp. 117]|uniref:protease inhibitor Inh/omp19 family protein n=1 Tax=Bosea sp. 117 TaxID=1125973 RepID=UPI0020C0F684|nr:protease inhibitor Inh/omp19 family protein [Bosea sp. 117]
MGMPKSGERSKRRVAAVLCLLGALLSPMAHAQEKADVALVTALAAPYQLTNADGDRVCPITLKADAAGAAGFAVEFDRTSCSELILFSADIAGWTPGAGDTIRLQDRQGRLVAEFSEGVGGTWEALRENDGVYFLVNPRLADPAEQAQPADLFGAWDIARAEGAPVCRVTLGEGQIGDGDFALTLAAGCDTGIVRFAPDRWRIERGDLVMLNAKGDRLRFAKQEEGGWARVPEGNRPLLLSRPAP